MSGRAIRIASIVLVSIAALAFGWLAVTALVSSNEPSPPFVVAQNDEIQEDLVVTGRSVEIVGHVRGGVLALGGDVTISGSVDGDVAAIGGSVIQQAKSHISGDVLIVGGHYEHAGDIDCRGTGTETVVLAGSGQSLREFFANPTRELLIPHIDRNYLGWRLAAALSSFLIALLFVAVAPRLISRASERLASDSLRIAAIGLVGTIAGILIVSLALITLPAPFAAIISGFLLVALVVVQLFGRVVAYFLVGRWLQKNMLGNRSRSQTVALLLGVLVLAFLSSLPVLGALLVFATFILSIGIILTMPVASAQVS
ncbi:MAG TPA: polymer-forming cytoskeletal protein [Blastocatellia bacterium]|nr:polymer-forming cytoskeletal protein [Blastocatellia bacterium]